MSSAVVLEGANEPVVGRAAPAPLVDPIVRAPSRPRIHALAIHRGEDAWAKLSDPAFLVEWERLGTACPWSTPCQSSHFVRTWFEHYRSRYWPIVVTLRSDDGMLVGLLALAVCLRTQRVAVAGAHQAEYQAWLATPECQREFIVRALAALDELLPGYELTFKYLPHGLPVEPLLGSPLFRSRARLVAHRRPLMRLDADELKRSLRKKSNKSRWSRLQRLGKLEFSRITDPGAFEAAFDEIIASYDERQRGAHAIAPFAADPLKKAFHLGLMRAAPGLLHVTVTTLAGKVIAAHVGLAGRDEVTLAIVCHDEALAEHSPGKLHLLKLGERLLQEGVGALDLTPGGDPWKERFANAHDEVHVLTLHRSAAVRQVRSLEAGARTAVKRMLESAGVPPGEVRRRLGELRRRFAPATA